MMTNGDRESFVRYQALAMTDLKNPTLIYLKGWLFLVAGAVAAGLLLAEAPRLKVALLLATCVWCFCRFYYFAFYVIQHYVDPAYKFAGLGSFFIYLFTSRSTRKGGMPRQ
jgi:hypothetical protein